MVNVTVSKSNTVKRWHCHAETIGVVKYHSTTDIKMVKYVIKINPIKHYSKNMIITWLWRI